MLIIWIFFLALLKIKIFRLAFKNINPKVLKNATILNYFKSYIFLKNLNKMLTLTN